MFIAGLKNNCVRRTIPPPYILIKPLFLQGFFYVRHDLSHLGTLFGTP